MAAATAIATGIGTGTGMAPLSSPGAATAAPSIRLIIPSALTAHSPLPAPTRRSGRRPRRRRLLSAPAVARSDSDGVPALSPSPSSSGNGTAASASALTFQQAIQRLQEYWASVGCAVMQCSNTEVGATNPPTLRSFASPTSVADSVLQLLQVGAGTMNPLTFLRVLGPEPWNVA
jgi:glycyl-tRNA synthetase